MPYESQYSRFPCRAVLQATLKASCSRTSWELILHRNRDRGISSVLSFPYSFPNPLATSSEEPYTTSCPTFEMGLSLGQTVVMSGLSDVLCYPALHPHGEQSSRSGISHNHSQRKDIGIWK